LEKRAQTPSVIGEPRRRPALLICLVAGFMTLLDVSIVNVALPSMERSLRMSPADVSWAVAGYALTFGLTLVPAGRLGDEYGRRRLFLAGLSLFALTAIICGAAPDATTLVVGRLCRGVATGLLAPQVIGPVVLGALAIGHRVLPADQKNRVHHRLDLVGGRRTSASESAPGTPDWRCCPCRA
jgi:MFS family permease